jgi:hypothetical protein
LANVFDMAADNVDAAKMTALLHCPVVRTLLLQMMVMNDALGRLRQGNNHPLCFVWAAERRGCALSAVCDHRHIVLHSECQYQRGCRSLSLFDTHARARSQRRGNELSLLIFSSISLSATSIDRIHYEARNSIHSGRVVHCERTRPSRHWMMGLGGRPSEPDKRGIFRSRQRKAVCCRSGRIEL